MSSGPELCSLPRAYLPCPGRADSLASHFRIICASSQERRQVCESLITPESKYCTIYWRKAFPSTPDTTKNQARSLYLVSISITYLEHEIGLLPGTLSHRIGPFSGCGEPRCARPAWLGGCCHCGWQLSQLPAPPEEEKLCCSGGENPPGPFHSEAGHLPILLHCAWR